MKRNLTKSQYITIASMLFGLFFGAGNLIFPVSMGQMAGSHLWPAIAGFLITGVGLPLLGVAALGISRCSGLREMSQRIGKRYGTLFTCALYLTIGPFFAIPRCATVPFAVGIKPLLSPVNTSGLSLAAFSFCFFLIVLWFSLRPSGILTWVGRILNPLFLILLGFLVITSFAMPLGQASLISPAGGYADSPFLQGFLEGYNTMDALAGLAFGIIVVHVIRSLGVEEPGAIARCTVKAGLLSSALMAVIYILVAIIGAQSRAAFGISDNGGTALAQIARHYYGVLGALILALTVTLACLKTSVGLITSCSETFASMFPKALSYRQWALLFSAVSFGIANLGLNTILQISLPVLMFLYPLAITLILLSLCGGLFKGRRLVSLFTTAGALPAAALDFAGALPQPLKDHTVIRVSLETADRYLPLFSHGLGWLLPSLTGLLLGLLLSGHQKSR